ncbi:MAG: hypothetical protein Q7W54_06800, partial [Bacteroidota bacterium]|nr:hypothetical protein [Bacteroidota bacterium]
YLLVLASSSKQSECVNNYSKILIISHITKQATSFFKFGKVELGNGHKGNNENRPRTSLFRGKIHLSDGIAMVFKNVVK